MNILLYKPLHYDLNKCANDINFFSDEGIINAAINSFFLAEAPMSFRWLETFRRDHYRGGSTYLRPHSSWSLSNLNKEVFKKFEVVSV